MSFSKIKEELKKSLEGKRINRIFKNNEYTISIHFGKIELLLSCIPSLPICYITKSKEQPILDIAFVVERNSEVLLIPYTILNLFRKKYLDKIRRVFKGKI